MSRRAFTLVEVLMVVLILGIVGAASVAYVGGRDDLKVAAAARRLTSGVQYAQNLSIARRVPHYVVELDGWLVVCTREGGAWTPIDHPAGGGRVGVDLTAGVVRDDKHFGKQAVLGFDETGQPFTCGARRQRPQPAGGAGGRGPEGGRPPGEADDRAGDGRGPGGDRGVTGPAFAASASDRSAHDPRRSASAISKRNVRVGYGFVRPAITAAGVAECSTWNILVPPSPPNPRRGLQSGF